MKIQIACLLLTLGLAVNYLHGDGAQVLAQLAPLPDNGAPRATLTLVDRLGGPALAVAVQAHYAFVGYSFELAVLDITNRATPQRVAYLPISASELRIVASRLYAIGRNGLHIIDLTQPTQPKLLGF